MTEQALQLWVKVCSITAQEMWLWLQKSRSGQDMVREEHNPVTLVAEPVVTNSRASCMNAKFKYSLDCVKPCSKNKTVDFIKYPRVQRWGDTTVDNVCLASWDPWQPCKELGKAEQACNPGFAGQPAQLNQKTLDSVRDPISKQ